MQVGGLDWPSRHQWTVQDEDDKKAGPSKKENKSVLKPEVTQMMPTAIGLKREVQSDRSHQTIPEDDPHDEIRELLQSLKLAIKTLSHKKTSAAAALHTLHFIGMSCESLLAGKRLYQS